MEKRLEAKKKGNSLKKSLFLLFLILVDQITKFTVLKYFPSWVVFNQGIAFGLLPSFSWLPVNLLILVLIIWLLKKNFAVFLLLAGGSANIIDRLLWGGVIDFIKLRFWPSFNLADIYICVGVIILFLGPVSKKEDFFRHFAS